MSDLNLEEAIPGHLITERTQPLHGPDNFEPKMASYTGRLGEDIKGLVVLYLGVQAPIGVDKRAVIKNLRVHITDPLVGFYDEGFFTDINGYSNHLIAAYWKSKNDFQSWQNKLPVGWWYAGITPGGEIGVYWERYEPSIDDTEIIYSHDDRPEGWGNLAEKVSKPINKHGYWGSAQDRIPRSQTEDLKPTGSCQIINPGTGLLQVKPQENLVILRSAQDWSDTLDKERTFYKKGVEPVLMKGMKEIEDGLRLGCYFNRVVTLGDPENAQQKTYSSGYALPVSQAGLMIGIIGMGDMGRLYARKISAAGWKVIACDTPEKYAELKAEFEDAGSLITIVENGHLVSRCSDYIIYNVPAESIDAVVKLYGPSTKMGAIVGGQTSCKAPEIAAFEAHLPKDVEIVSCHSLHGPKVDSRGQPLAIISHRASAESTALVTRVLACLQSKIVHLSAIEHDRITADTQAVTHAAFLSMGTAWHANAQFPWELERYSTGGVENVKINIMMRIYSNKWHVYAGLAILNPAARDQIRAYADSVTELFKLMISHQRKEFEERIIKAGEAVFGSHKGACLLLRDEILDQYSLAEARIPRSERRPNSHLSLLAMVDCWWKLGIVPYEHMICETPLFRLWLGVAEYLYRDRKMLEEAIETAMEDDAFRMDDLEFTFAARGWSEVVGYGDFESYRKRFEKVQTYFAPRVAEATRLGNEMIAKIFEKTRDGETPAKAS
ncbi:hypothetical protein Dda_2179 [Drechslerella dactyloides]|uniref:prephenate dehydrogenase (NADP(+)) n=1 Tax=Drechslerella dactyloides TaxID=74499 RepID=A0AAD6J756_DREDA|nr:hypothetical protein Dda_2179 [Drechslerella dactyloides]